MWARAPGPGSSVTRCGASKSGSGSADIPASSRSRTAAWLMVHLPGASGHTAAWRTPRRDRIETMQTGYGKYSPAGRAKRGPGGIRACGRAASVDDGVALLAHELGGVVHREAGLARAPGPLPATERLDTRPRAGGRAGPPVDVQHARLDLVEELGDLGGILAVHASRQAELALVGEHDRPAEGIDRGDRGERHEQLFPEDAVRGRQLHDRWLHEEAVCQRALGEALPANEDTAVPARLRHCQLVALDSARVDHRAQPVLPLQRIPDGDLLCLLDQQADQLVPDRSLHVDPAVRGALLAAEPEGRAHDPLGRLLEIGAGRDNGRVLASHLDDAGPREPRREASEQLEAHLVGSREHDPVDPLVGLELLPDGGPGSHHQVEDARRDARVDERLRQQDAGHRPRGRRLEYDRVAARQGPRRRPGRERDREVERADDGKDAERTKDRPRMDRRVTQVVHRVVVAGIALEHVRVVAQEVGRLLDLAERLETVLAHLERHPRRVLHLSLGDEVGGAAQHGEPIAPRRRSPCRLGRPGCRDRIADVVGGAFRERAHEDAVVDRRAELEGARAVAPDATDEVLVVGTQAGPGPGNARLVELVQLQVVVAERRVGDLDAFGHWRFPSCGRSADRQSSAATTSASETATASGIARERRAPARCARLMMAAASAARVLPVSTSTPRIPMRRAPSMAWAGSSPTIATSRAATRPPRPAARPARAVRNMIGPGLPHSTARTPVANSSAATKAPLSRVG